MTTIDKLDHLVKLQSALEDKMCALQKQNYSKYNPTVAKTEENLLSVEATTKTTESKEDLLEEACIMLHSSQSPAKLAVGEV